jgi:hypothetical protein
LGANVVNMLPCVIPELVFDDWGNNAGLNGHEDPRLATLEEPFHRRTLRRRFRPLEVKQEELPTVTLMTQYKFIGKTKTEVFIDPALLKKDALMN